MLFEPFSPVDTVLLLTFFYCIASVLTNKISIHSSYLAYKSRTAAQNTLSYGDKCAFRSLSDSAARRAMWARVADGDDNDLYDGMSSRRRWRGDEYDTCNVCNLAGQRVVKHPACCIAHYTVSQKNKTPNFCP